MHVLFSQLANLSFTRRRIYLKLIINIELDEIRPGEERAGITNYFAEPYIGVSGSCFEIFSRLKSCFIFISFCPLSSSPLPISFARYFEGKTMHRANNDSLRRRAYARNVSFRISLRWPIRIINPVDKTKLSNNKQV